MHNVGEGVLNEETVPCTDDLFSTDCRTRDNSRGWPSLVSLDALFVVYEQSTVTTSNADLILTHLESDNNNYQRQAARRERICILLMSCLTPTTPMSVLEL